VGASLDKLLLEYDRECRLVHRLDRETSGLLLVAKGAENAAFLTGLLSDKSRAEKTYLALCAGKPPEEQGLIDEPLEGRKALTNYRLLKTRQIMCIAGRGETTDPTNETLDVSLVELRLGTGRTHQLRRHLALIGCPILGDGKYGNFKLNKALRKCVELSLSRLCLHSYRLSIAEWKLDLEAPQPDVFKNF
jgi:23S rRNA pseudouridine955/2504/2580 synthase